MKTIKYCQEGEAFSDFDCEAKARKFLENQEDELDEVFLKVSTDNFIVHIRALIAEKLVSHKGVRFLFEGKYLQPNEGGRLPEWPKGFCDSTEKALFRILKATRKL